MYQWCKKWRLRLNSNKTKIVHFRGKRVKQTIFKFTYGSKAIDIVQCYKYLGIIFDEFMSYDECSKTLSESAGRALGALISKFKCFRDTGYETFTKLLDSGVQPILTYGSSVWGLKIFKDIDRVTNRACRYYLGLHKFTPIPALYSEMGWLPSLFYRQVNALRLWNRILNMNSERLTKKIFLSDYGSNSGWCQELNLLFKTLYMKDIFENLHLCDINLAMLKLRGNFETKWKIEVNN